MILDNIKNSVRYFALHPGFEPAFKFLKSPSMANLKEGKQLIDGERLFALGTASKGKGMEDTVFESHRKYIDIQFTVSGCDSIGWEEQPRLIPDAKGYDPDKDVEFYKDRPTIWVPVGSGQFAVFYPEDAHAPFATDAFIHKVIIKVALDWK